MRKSLASYMNKSSYREIHSSRSTVALSHRKHNNRAFTRYFNALVLGDHLGSERGLILFHEGVAVMNIKNNKINKETLYCFENMSYCYEIINHSSGYSLCMFYKQNVYLTLYTLKKGRQDGLQFSYDYINKTMTKSLYKNNHLCKIIQSYALNQYDAEQGEQFSNMFNKLLAFDFEVEGCKRIEIDKDTVYFGEVKNESPNGYGIILSHKQRYMGSFKDGLLEGFGTIYFQNHDICQGIFKEGEYDICAKYIKQYGTVFFVDKKPSNEEEYLKVVEKYNTRFTIDNNSNLDFPLRDILYELKDNLQIIQKKLKSKKYDLEVASDKFSDDNENQQDYQEYEVTYSSPSYKINGRTSPRISESPPALKKHILKKSPKKRSPKVINNLEEPQSPRYNLDSQKVDSLIKNQNFLGVANIFTGSLIAKHVPASRIPSPDQIQLPESNQNFFQSIVVEEVQKDTVSEEFNRNIPKCLQIKARDLSNCNQLNFVHQKTDNMISPYIMDMIKQNSGDNESCEKGVSNITERIKKSRIFPNKESRIGRVTFTF